MQQRTETFSNSLGRPVAGGLITVYNYPSGTVAVLYADNGLTPLANPVVADINGLYKYYAADGRYSEGLSSSTTQPLLLIDSVLLEDPVDGSSALAAPGGSVLVGHVGAGTGAVATTVQAELRQVINATGYGADTTGAVDAAGPLGNLFSNDNTCKRIPNGTYNLATDLTPAAADIDIDIAPGAAFTGAGKLRFESLIPFQNNPLGTVSLLRKTIGAAYAGFQNVFLRASYAIANVANVPVVALYAGAESIAASASCFAGNHVAYARNATATAIGLEVDVGSDVSGGTAYGVVIVSSNAFAAKNAIQIQSNTAAQFDDGIKFNFQPTFGCVRQALIRATAGYAATMENFIAVSGIRAGVLEVDLPSFAVGPTAGTGAQNKVQFNGATAGNAPRAVTTGPDTNIPYIQDTKGTGIQVFRIGTRDALRINYTALSVNYLAVVPGATGSAAGLQAEGSDANINFSVSPKGSGDTALANGNLLIQQVGKGIFVKEGLNAKQGIATLVAGTLVVVNTSVTANSRIMLTSQADGGTPGFLRVSARSAGASFTITSSSGADTSIVAYQIFEPA